MTQNVDRETVVSRLLAADDILILCHKNPDGDTIGSGTALCLALQQLGKNAAVLCSDPIPAMYDYMPITVFDGSFRPANHATRAESAKILAAFLEIKEGMK